MRETEENMVENICSRVQNFRPDIQKPRQMENVVRGI